MRLTLLALCLFASSTLSAAERVVERSIAVDPDVRFSIKSQRGGLVITTADVDTIELKARIEHDDRRVVDQVEIEVANLGSTVAVDVDYNEPGFRLNFGLIGTREYQYPEVWFTVVLPRDASLSVESHRSNLDLEVPSGRVDVTSHRGRGRISGVRNNLKIDADRADFDIEVVELRDVDLEFDRGDIDLVLRNPSDFTVAGETHRGSIRFRGRNYRINQSSRDSYVNVREGDGRNQINIMSHRGNTVIDFRD